MGGKILKRFVPMVAIDVATKQEAIDLFDKTAADRKNWNGIILWPGTSNC